MAGNQTKPRCFKCKSLLIKGTIVGGLALIECATCGCLNSVAVTDDKLDKLAADLRDKKKRGLWLGVNK